MKILKEIKFYWLRNFRSGRHIHSISGIELWPSQRDRILIDWMDSFGVSDTAMLEFWRRYPE